MICARAVTVTLSAAIGAAAVRSTTTFNCATGPSIECPVGITANEKSNPPKTLVQEVSPTRMACACLSCIPKSARDSRAPNARSIWSVYG